MTGATIAGLGIALPSTELTNEAVGAHLSVTPDWIVSRTGIRTRRIAAAHETASSLGTAAAMDAIGDARVKVQDIDLVICATVTPDHVFPAAACAIQAHLGIAAPAFDLNAGCSGFLFALAQAHAAIAAGTADTVLVVGSEVLSRITDRDDAKTAALFGDGAGAAIVRRVASDDLGPFQLRSDGGKPELLFVDRDSGFIHMEGREVYRAAVEHMAGSVADLLRVTGLGTETVDLVVAHQANQRILDAVADRLQIDRAKMFSNIARYGNTSAASIPIALYEAREQGLLTAGDRVVVTAFGAGFTWGAALVRWGVTGVSSPRAAAGDRAGA